LCCGSCRIIENKEENDLVTVLITGAQSITGYNTARAIQDENIILWGLSTNINAFECRSNLWDALYYCDAETESVIKTLIQIGIEYKDIHCDNKKIGLLISEDYVVRAVSEYRKEIEKYFCFALPDQKTIELFLDKTLFHEWAKNQGYTLPKSCIINSHESLKRVLEDYNYPLILKPSERTDVWDNSNSIKGIKLNHSRDIEDYKSELFKFSPSYIVQEWIPGDDYDIYFCLFYYSKDGKEVAHFTGRKLLQWPLENGSTSICIGIEDDNLYRQSLEILSAVNYKGLGSVEFKKSKADSKYYVIEPTVGRNDLQSFVAVASGVNLSKIAIHDLFPDVRITPAEKTRAIWINGIGLLRGLVKKPSLVFRLDIYFHLLISRIAFALLNCKDPKPFYFSLKKNLSLLLRKTANYLTRKLKLASNNTHDAIQNNRVEDKIIIRRLSEDDFRGMKDLWSHLLNKSNADPLFLGWHWQSLWWDQWSKKRQYSLYLLAAYSSANELLGIAPLYKYKPVNNRLFNHKIIQFIGSSWGDVSTVRSEYLDFIIDSNHSNNVKEEIFKYIFQDEDWGQFIFSDIDVVSNTYSYIYTAEWIKKYLIREVQRQKSTYIKTTGRYADYISMLGSNARYKIINRRIQIYKTGELIFNSVNKESINNYFEYLNECHYERWGKPCFSGDSLEFHKRLARIFFDEKRLFFTKMSILGKDVSILYNLKAGNRIYNIQSGFEVVPESKLSPGLMHFGVAIENAFSDEGVEYFDLLAGPGKNTYYKSRFGKMGTELATVQITRNTYLKYIYTIYDMLPIFAKTRLVKLFTRR